MYPPPADFSIFEKLFVLPHWHRKPGEMEGLHGQVYLLQSLELQFVGRLSLGLRGSLVPPPFSVFKGAALRGR